MIDCLVTHLLRLSPMRLKQSTGTEGFYCPIMVTRSPQHQKKAFHGRSQYFSMSTLKYEKKQKSNTDKDSLFLNMQIILNDNSRRLR